MKYTCEICGTTFVDIKACESHENECKYRNQMAICITDTLNRIVTDAQCNNIKLGVSSYDVNKKTLIPFEKISFNANRNAIIVELADAYVKLDEVKHE